MSCSARTGVVAMTRTVLVGLVLAVALVGCSSGGDADDAEDSDVTGVDGPLDGDDRDAYVVAFEDAGRDPTSGELTDEAGCTAEAIVDGIGVDEMRDVATPREIAAAANGQGASLTDLGLEVDTEQADAIYEGIEACGDPALAFLDAIPGPALAPSDAQCFADQVDDELLRRIVMTRLVDGDDALAADTEIASQLTAIGRDCAAGGAQ